MKIQARQQPASDGSKGTVPGPEQLRARQSELNQLLDPTPQKPTERHARSEAKGGSVTEATDPSSELKPASSTSAYPVDPLDLSVIWTLDAGESGWRKGPLSFLVNDAAYLLWHQLPFTLRDPNGYLIVEYLGERADVTTTMVGLAEVIHQVMDYQLYLAERLKKDAATSAVLSRALLQEETTAQAVDEIGL